MTTITISLEDKKFAEELLTYLKAGGYMLINIALEADAPIKKFVIQKRV